MRTTTLCLLIQDEMVCLGIKKKKLGKGKYNGFGGFVEEGESIDSAAVRELEEESTVIAQSYHKVAEMTYLFPESPEWNQTMHVYLVDAWIGTAQETPEMGVDWFSIFSLPYDHMWENDRYWMSDVLAGKKVKGTVIHGEDKLISKELSYVTHF